MTKKLYVLDAQNLNLGFCINSSFQSQVPLQAYHTLMADVSYSKKNTLDELVRNVTFKTKNSVLDQSVTKTILLEAVKVAEFM